MKKYQLTDDGYYSGVVITSENDDIPGIVTEEELIGSSIQEKLANKWDSDNNKWLFDENKYLELLKNVKIPENAAKIEQYKEQLKATDYKIIKCQEYILVGKDLPYDVELLHNERQTLRDKINELESSREQEDL